MKKLAEFKSADAKVTEIENKGGIFSDGYNTVTTKEYDDALLEAQRLFFELEQLGISPF